MRDEKLHQVLNFKKKKKKKKKKKNRWAPF